MTAPYRYILLCEYAYVRGDGTPLFKLISLIFVLFVNNFNLVGVGHGTH